MPQWSIEGYAIVCEAGCIADDAGALPRALMNDADWAYFQAGLDGSAAVVLGRLSHEAAPDDKGRLRVVVSSSAKGLERRGRHWWWDPASAPVTDMLAAAAPEGGRIGAPGGRAVFDLFLGHGWDAFHLSRKAGVRLEGGVPVFSGACAEPGRRPEDMLASRGLAPGPVQVLDAGAGVTLAVWRREGEAMSEAAGARARGGLITPVLVAGSLILLISFGLRSTFGVFQIPVAETFGWPRAEFSLAIAIQNLAWGIGQPIFAAAAEKWGERMALTIGTLCYAAGLALSAAAMSPEAHQGLNLMIGFGAAGTGFGVILAVIGRSVSDEQRSMALALATAAGSIGQIIFPPLAEALIGAVDYDGAFLVLAAIALGCFLLIPAVSAGGRQAPGAAEDTVARALKRAFRDPSYTLIFLGFFSCGYQIAFMTAHFPAFVTEACAAIDPGGMLASLGVSSTSALGAWAIAVVGVMNIAGTITAGKLGNMFPRKYLLSLIYLGRTIAASAFILMPMTPASVLVFSAVMGTLWLATVPLTAGLVGHIYGLRYMGTLYGIIFLSHQLGSFVGVWLGGALYDRYGSYDLVWWIGVGVGAFSALVHLPVRERPLEVVAGA